MWLAEMLVLALTLWGACMALLLVGLRLVREVFVWSLPSGGYSRSSDASFVVVPPSIADACVIICPSWRAD